MPYLRDTLLVLSSEKDGPCNATGVLALQEEGFGLAILEAEDLAITTDVELALHTILSAFRLLSIQFLNSSSCQPLDRSSPPRRRGERISVPFQGRSSHRRRYRRRYAY
jgi:hypothetical protein